MAISSMEAFADLSSRFHRDQIVGGYDNVLFLERCHTIINLLHQANAEARFLEAAFEPEPKKKVSLFPMRKKQEVIDVCPE